LLSQGENPTVLPPTSPIYLLGNRIPILLYHFIAVIPFAIQYSSEKLGSEVLQNVPVLTGVNYFPRSVSQDLVEGCDFYFAWFLQQGVRTWWSCMISPTEVLKKARRLWRLRGACAAFPLPSSWLFRGRLIKEFAPCFLLSQLPGNVIQAKY